MKPYLMTLAMLVAATLLLDAAGVNAQRFPRELENIKMFGKGETIEFIFTQPYEGNPVADYQAGAFSLNFSGTGSTKPVRSLRPVEESIFKEVKVVQNRYSTTVSFVLKDAALNLRDKLAFVTDRKTLRVAVNAPAGEPVTSPQGQATQDLLREMETRIAGNPAGTPADIETATAQGADIPAGTVRAATGTAGGTASGGLALGDLGGSQFFYSLLTMVIALVIIIGALYGMLYIYNRFLAGRLRRFTGSHSIRQVASFHIGPRQRIVVLEINGEVIACGVTPAQITYLTHLGGKGPVGHRELTDKDSPSSGDPSPGAGMKGAGLRAGGLTDAAPGDPVHQFAEVLKDKVRSLKRIN